ncbi:hypothetical protein TYRP_009094 [Tyrophagus putrescentiae]|nr:hypothetical protein TYRP_009094 [Tyrophagus putrescentiae]
MSQDVARCLFTLEHFADCSSLRYSSFFSPPTNNSIQFELFLNPSHAVPLCDDTFTFIFLYLHKCNVEELPVRYRISVINSRGEKVNTQEGTVSYQFKSKGRYNGLYHISRSTLLDPANGLLSETGSLKIDCEVEILGSGDQVDSSSSSNSGHKNSRKLGDSILADYQALLDSGDYSDVTLILGDQKIPAHKAVLSARSGYFAAAFKENPETSELSVNFEEKPAKQGETSSKQTPLQFTAEVFQDLLRYIYTGKVQSLDRLAVELLQAAVHFQIPSLVAICEQSLAANLSTDSVASILLLADRYQAKTLKEKCIEYIIDMAEIVTVTDGWRQLTATAHAELAFELFTSVISKLHK